MEKIGISLSGTDREAIQAVAEGAGALLNCILLRLASKDVNDDGESEWLTLVLGHISKDGVSDGGKSFAMGVIAAVEHTLRELAKMNKGNKGGS